MKISQFTLPQRRDRIRQLRDSGTSEYEFQLFFQEQLRTLPVYIVDVGLPCYRLQNGRTRASQLEMIATEGLPNDFFTADPDSEPALKKQDEILRQMLKEANLLRTFRKIRQDRPLILDSDGYVINGNRRLCAMRLLLQEDEVFFAHFKHIQVIFLPPCEERDIKELEGRLQVQPDLRADYSWTAEAMLYRDLRSAGWNDENIANLYQKNISHVRETIAMLEDAEYYLDTRSNSGKYSLIVRKEYAFRQLQKNRKKCGEDEARKQILVSFAYLMLDDPDSSEGRLYESIPEAHKFLDSIVKRLQEGFSEQINRGTETDDGFEILGENSDEGFEGIVQVLQKPENMEQARAVIRDVLEEKHAEERERKDAMFCLRQIQQADTKLQSALSALDENAETTGIEESIKNIGLSISEILDWLGNGNNQN